MTDPSSLDPGSRLMVLLAAAVEPPRDRDARARVFSRLQASIDSGSSGERNSGVVARIRRPRPRWAGLRFAAALAVASIGGAAAHEAWMSPAPRVVYVDRVVAPPPESLPAPVTRSRAPRQPEAPGPKEPILAAENEPRMAKAPALLPSSPAPKPASSLAEEVALIEGAQAALSRLDAATALATLDEHVRRYPTATLAQERDALFVRTFVALGRYDDAREHARRFELNFPNSSLRGSVEKALRAIP